MFANFYFYQRFYFLISNLGGLKFDQDENGNWGYRIEGADTVIPFKKGIESLVSLVLMMNVQNTYRGDFVAFSDDITLPSSAARITTYTCNKSGTYHIRIISRSSGVANQDGYFKVAGTTIVSSAYTSAILADDDYTLAEGETIEIRMGTASSSGGGNGFAMLIYKNDV